MVLSASAVDLLTPRTRSSQYFRGKNESRDASTRLTVRKRTIKLAQRDRRPFEVVASSPRWDTFQNNVRPSQTI